MKTSLTIAGWLACTLAFAQGSPPVPTATPAPTQRLRGTVESFDGTTLVLQERSGERISMGLAENFSLNEVVAVELGAIQPGSYVGSAAMPMADGTLRALAVAVFPDSFRGVGEGHMPWDLQPGSTMTNATVGSVASAPRGRTLKLIYKGARRPWRCRPTCRW